jgi:type VI secretion system protein ImpE
MRALELFNEGRLTQAIAEARDAVKNQPADTTQRLILSELLCFVGEFEKADKHLETAFMQSPELNLPTALSRQLIRAATARKKCFADGAVPDMLSPIDPIVEEQLRLWTFHRGGDADRVAESIGRLQSYCDAVEGTVDGERFSGFRDLGDANASCLEILTTMGKYYWLPWQRIEFIQFEPIKRPRDLLWREANIIVREGPDAVVYVPVCYPDTTPEKGDAALLGRTTEWNEFDTGVVNGIGQRVFLIGDQEMAILDLKEIRFDGKGVSEAMP